MESASQPEILREIQLIMKELFDLDADRVRPEARLIEDLELDSLDAIDLAVKVEEMTGHPLDENQIRQMKTIQDVVVALQVLLRDKPGKLAAAQADS